MRKYASRRIRAEFFAALEAHFAANGQDASSLPIIKEFQRRGVGRSTTFHWAAAAKRSGVRPQPARPVSAPDAESPPALPPDTGQKALLVPAVNPALLRACVIILADDIGKNALVRKRVLARMLQICGGQPA